MELGIEMLSSSGKSRESGSTGGSDGGRRIVRKNDVRHESMFSLLQPTVRQMAVNCLMRFVSLGIEERVMQGRMRLSEESTSFEPGMRMRRRQTFSHSPDQNTGQSIREEARTLCPSECSLVYSLRPVNELMQF